MSEMTQAEAMAKARRMHRGKSFEFTLSVGNEVNASMVAKALRDLGRQVDDLANKSFRVTRSAAK
jgi:hypothetical protein